MHSTLTTLVSKLNELAAQVQAVVPNDEPLGIAHGTGNLPGLNRADFIEEAHSLARLIEEQGLDDIGSSEPRLIDYVRRLEHLRVQTVGHLWSGNGGQAASAYMLTLNGLRKSLETALGRDGYAEAANTLRRLTTQLRAMEARIKALDPKTASLSDMVERIEKAYNAADQLPTDLESLSEARLKIEGFLRDAGNDQRKVLDISNGAIERDTELKRIASEAEAVLERCEQAYSASTSVGLAAAFSERSASLSKSMWTWVGGLITALAAGGYFGTHQLQSLNELLKSQTVLGSTVALNLMLSLLSVAAPVWFAWIATKQIGQRFRLSEDYAFKASISRAYEGYRQEAHRIDKDLEARLLESALDRLDEQPLRIVEPDNHGSPWHELLSSDVVKQAVRAVPDFASQVKDLASKRMASLTPVKAKSQTEPPEVDKL
jgi:hypothetical protein